MKAKAKTPAAPPNYGIQALARRLPPDLEPPEPASPRGRILEAARELFARRGFDGASTRDIAERAGVNLAMLGYYYGGKELLYRRVVAGQFAALIRELTAELPAKLSPEEFVLGQVRRMVSLLRRHPDWVQLVRRELADGGERLRSVLFDLGDAGPIGALQEMVRAYSEAAGRGKLRRLPPRTVVQFIISLAYGILFVLPLFQAVGGEDFDDEKLWSERLQGFDAIIRHGLEAPGRKR